MLHYLLFWSGLSSLSLPGHMSPRAFIGLQDTLQYSTAKDYYTKTTSMIKQDPHPDIQLINFIIRALIKPTMESNFK